MATLMLLFCIVDKVFGPATETQDVYEIAAQPVIESAMDGINGKVPLILHIPRLPDGHN